MKIQRAIGTSSAVLLLLAGTTIARAQSDDSTIALTVEAGRPLEVVLDARVSITRVGQPVTGTLVEPLYAYDRIVVPAGTKVLGHVAALEGPSRIARTRALLAGDLTPPRHVVLQFDTLLPAQSDPVPIQTVVKVEVPHLKRSAAPPADAPPPTNHAIGVARDMKVRASDAVSAAKQRGRDVLAEITQPGRMARMKDALVQQLPYHPQIISPGTGYQVELIAPLDFGRATPSDAALTTARPAPSSQLNARLVTSLDSSKTPRGSLIQAMVTEPVFSVDHQLIYPEGTVLDGEVTWAVPARRFHRNGQLRFLFERVHAPSADPSPLLASLESVQASDDDRLAIDDEGGVTATDSKTRFIAPALALLALRANLDRGPGHLDPDGDGHIIHSSRPGALGTGGFLGLGVLGIGLSQVWRPAGVALSAVGAAKTLYGNVLGKGREVQFPADTLIQLQLAPEPLHSP